MKVFNRMQTLLDMLCNIRTDKTNLLETKIITVMEVFEGYIFSTTSYAGVESSCPGYRFRRNGVSMRTFCKVVWLSVQIGRNGQQASYSTQSISQDTHTTSNEACNCRIGAITCMVQCEMG